uniref:Uncharacterized protein n=1 Tax=viral metagenome TaxID=1070528 RepID=A0A6M3IQZ3_9ZZZZ
MPDKSVRELLKEFLIGKQQEGSIGNILTSCEEAVIKKLESDLASAVRGMPRTAFLGRYAKTIREITINDVARWVEGKEGR